MTSIFKTIVLASIVLLLGNVSFVYAGDSEDTSSSSSDNTVTGTYDQYSDGSSSVTSSCDNASSCSSLTYDNGLTIYDYAYNPDSGTYTGYTYVNGDYVPVTQVDSTDGTVGANSETWVYDSGAPGGGYYIIDTGTFSSSDDSSTDSSINDFTGSNTNTTNQTTTSDTTCSAFSFSCFAVSSGTGNAPSSGGSGAFNTTSSTNNGVNFNFNFLKAPPTLSACPGSTIPPGATSCAFNAIPDLVRKDTQTRLYVYVESIGVGDRCAISSLPFIAGLPSWSAGPVWINPSGYSVTITQKTIFTLTCTTADGSSSSVSKTVSLVPTYREL